VDGWFDLVWASTTERASALLRQEAVSDPSHHGLIKPIRIAGREFGV
jgi:hypothetical protein